MGHTKVRCKEPPRDEGMGEDGAGGFSGDANGDTFGGGGDNFGGGGEFGGDNTEVVVEASGGWDNAPVAAAEETSGGWDNTGGW